MKLTIDRNKLAEAVTSAAQGLSSRPSSPVHAGLLVSAVGEMAQFTASDGFTAYNCITDAESGADGQFFFPRVFTEIVRTLPGGEVGILAEKGIGTVTCGKSRFTFPVLPGTEPGGYVIPNLDLPLLGEVDGPEFRMALRKVLPALDLNSVTPAFTAVRMEVGLNLGLVATDSYTIAVSDCDVDVTDCDHEGKVVLLPGRVAEKAARMEGARMALCLDGSTVQVRSGGFSITCPQLSAKYPRWDIILSMGEQWAKLPEDLGDAVKRAALTLGEKEPVSLSFAAQTDELPGELVVSTDGSKGGFTETFGFDEYKGPPVTVRVGHLLLRDALNWCDEVSVEIGRPLLFRGEGVRYLVQTRRDI